MNRTLSVAANDFLNVRRSKLLWGVTGLYLAMLLLMFYFEGQKNDPGVPVDPSLQGVMRSMTVIGALIIPLVALVAAYLSIAGERESGSIKFRLSLPTTRREFLLGKFLSRSAAVSVGVLVSLAVAGLYGAFGIENLDVELGKYLVFTGFTLLFTVTYVAIAVGISAMTASRSRAMGSAIAFFFVFNVYWLLQLGPLSIEGTVDWLAGELGWELATKTKLLIKTLSPGFAYGGALGEVVYDFHMASQLPGNPWYLQPWVQVLVLLAWLVVPLTAGYVRFRRAELG